MPESSESDSSSTSSSSRSATREREPSPEEYAKVQEHQAVLNAAAEARLREKLSRPDLPENERVSTKARLDRIHDDNSYVERFMQMFFGPQDNTSRADTREGPVTASALADAFKQAIRGDEPEVQFDPNGTDILKEHGLIDLNRQAVPQGYAAQYENRRRDIQKKLKEDFEANPNLLEKFGWTGQEVRYSDDPSNPDYNKTIKTVNYLSEAAQNILLDELSGRELPNDKARKDYIDKFKGTQFADRERFLHIPNLNKALLDEAGYEIISVQTQTGYESKFFWPKDPDRKIQLLRTILYFVEDDLLQDSGVAQNAMQELNLVLPKLATEGKLGQQMMLEFRRRLGFLSAYGAFYGAKNNDELFGAIGNFHNAWFDSLVRDSGTFYEGTEAKNSNLYVQSAFRLLQDPKMAHRMFLNPQPDYGFLRDELRQKVRDLYPGRDISDETIKSSVLLAVRLWEISLMRAKMVPLVNKRTQRAYDLTNEDPHIREQQWEALLRDSAHGKDKNGKKRDGVDFMSSMDKLGNDVARNNSALWLFYRANGYNLNMKLLTGEHPYEVVNTDLDKNKNTAVDLNYRDLFSLIPNDTETYMKKALKDWMRQFVYKGGIDEKTDDQLVELTDAWGKDLTRAITGHEVEFIDQNIGKKDIFDISKDGIHKAKSATDDKKIIGGDNKTPFDAMGISVVNMTKMAYKAQDLADLRKEGVIEDWEFERRVAVLNKFFKVNISDKNKPDDKEILTIEQRVSESDDPIKKAQEDAFYAEMYITFQKDNQDRKDPNDKDEGRKSKDANNLFSFEWVQAPAQRVSRLIKRPTEAMEAFHKDGEYGQHPNPQTLAKYAQMFSWLRDSRYTRQIPLLGNYAEWNWEEGTYASNSETMDFIMSRLGSELNLAKEDLDQVYKHYLDHKWAYSPILRFVKIVPIFQLLFFGFFHLIWQSMKATSAPKG